MDKNSNSQKNSSKIDLDMRKISDSILDLNHINLLMS